MCPTPLQAHTDVRRLEFLPYHFLLASVGEQGTLRYQVSLSCTRMQCHAVMNSVLLL